MHFQETGLAGCYRIELAPRGDERGSFARVFCAQTFREQGLCADFVQANSASSAAAGTLRGMHYQTAQHAEDKLVRCTAGRLFDVAVDLRPDSPSYRRWFGTELSADNDQMLYVPKGCAHGYLTLEDDTVAHYMVTASYAPGAEGGFRWDDPAIGIEWPMSEGLILSEKICSGRRSAAPPDPPIESHRVGRDPVAQEFAAMLIVDTALQKRADGGNPIRVGVIGAGYMGRGMILQIISAFPGMRVAAVYNRTIDTAEQAYTQAGVGDVQRVSDLSALENAIDAGRPVITDDPMLIAEAGNIDCLVEATGEVEFGAHVVVRAIEHRKHVVLLNAELDAVVGPELKVMADEAGVVISNCDGDQPGVIMNLLRWVKSIGYEPRLLGNMKGLQDHYRNPTTQQGFADAVKQKPKMITSFADGTKISMEMVVVANATGFKVGQRGMYGPSAKHVTEAPGLFDVDELREGGLVDYILGAEPGPGVFVLATRENEILAQYAQYLKMGDGPLYTFYVPYHLPHLETPLTVARAVLFEDAAAAPMGGPVCDVLTAAKIDLKAGQTIDGIGGYHCYGTIDNYAVSRAGNCLPMSLSEGCVLKRDIARDEIISYDDVELPAGRLVDQLRARQTERFG